MKVQPDFSVTADAATSVTRTPEPAPSGVDSELERIMAQTDDEVMFAELQDHYPHEADDSAQFTRKQMVDYHCFGFEQGKQLMQMVRVAEHQASKVVSGDAVTDAMLEAGREAGPPILRGVADCELTEVFEAMLAASLPSTVAGGDAVKRVAQALEREFDRVVDERNGDPDFEAAALTAITAMSGLSDDAA